MKREPVANKRTSSLDDIANDLGTFGAKSRFDVDPKIAKLAEEKGLALRWLSAKQFKEEQGFNKSGWVPLREQHLIDEGIDLSDNPFGTFNAEGFILRGTMLLAIRSMRVHKQQQQRNREAALRAKNKVKSDADQLSERVRREGGNLSINIKDEA